MNDLKAYNDIQAAKLVRDALIPLFEKSHFPKWAKEMKGASRYSSPHNTMDLVAPSNNMGPGAAAILKRAIKSIEEERRTLKPAPFQNNLHKLAASTEHTIKSLLSKQRGNANVVLSQCGRGDEDARVVPNPLGRAYALHVAVSKVWYLAVRQRGLELLVGGRFTLDAQLIATTDEGINAFKARWFTCNSTKAKVTDGYIGVSEGVKVIGDNPGEVIAKARRAVGRALIKELVA